MKNKNIFKLLLVMGFAFIIFGTSYAFFEYNKVGANHELIAGDIYMNLDGNNNSLTLSSIYPETKEDARNRDDNYITFTISGANESENDIYYEIDLIHGIEKAGFTRFNDKDLCFDLIEVNGSNETIIMASVSFTEINNSKIWVETIDGGTANYSKTYKIRMWLDENVIISDNVPNASYSASTYSNYYASIKVKVVGDFAVKSLYNVMGTFPTVITDQKANITEVYFINDSQSSIDTRYNAATIKADVTNTSHSVGTQQLQNLTDYGKVLAWLENDTNNTGKYILYVGSDGPTYLSTGSFLFGSNMSSNGWKYLSKIDFSNAKTDFVIDMSSMFRCTGYEATTFELLGLDSWNTSSVTNMSDMFHYAGYRATTFELLGLDSWNTSSVTNMSNMFNEAGRNITSTFSLDLSGWNTSSVTNMSDMFYCAGYSAQTWSIGDLSKWNTSNVTNMSEMFKQTGHSAQTWNIGDLSKWNTSNVTNMSDMFGAAGYSTQNFELDLSGWNTSSVTNMSNMFNCAGYSATTWNIGNISKWNTSSVTNMSSMFNCAGYSTQNFELDLSGWNTSSVTNMSSMFNSAGYIAQNFELDLSGWNTISVTNMSSMFYYAGYKATTFELIGLNSWNTSSVTNMSDMFNCAGYIAQNFELDLSGWNTSNVTNMSSMFYYARKISKIYVGSNWSTASATTSTNMFYGCSSLVGGNGTVYSGSHTNASYAHVDTAGNPGYLTLKS